jgi:hypothetical protein
MPSDGRCHPVDDAIGDGVIEKDGVAEGVDRES